MAAAATYKSLRNLVLLMSAALAAAPLASAQDYIEIVKIDVVVPDRPAANTTLYPGQDNVWDIQISEVFRVFVTYRVRMGTDTFGDVVLVQHRTDTGEDLSSNVTTPFDPDFRFDSSLLTNSVLSAPLQMRV